MKYFNVKINGNLYEVEVEEVAALQGIQSNANARIAPADARVAVAAPIPAAKPVAASVAEAPSGAGRSIECPMPGKILDIKVAVGDVVAENQPVVTLEAMKMENEIVTPYAGKVAQIKVTKGQNINSGELIMTITE